MNHNTPFKKTAGNILLSGLDLPFLVVQRTAFRTKVQNRILYYKRREALLWEAQQLSIQEHFQNKIFSPLMVKRLMAIMLMSSTNFGKYT